jgi:hypothetical protein
LIANSLDLRGVTTPQSMLNAFVRIAAFAAGQ